MKIKRSLLCLSHGTCSVTVIVAATAVGDIHVSWMKWAESHLAAQAISRAEVKYSQGVEVMSEKEGIQSLIRGVSTAEEHGAAMHENLGKGSESRKSPCSQHRSGREA